MTKDQIDHAVDDFVVARDIGDDETIRSEFGIGAAMDPAIAARLASL